MCMPIKHKPSSLYLVTILPVLTQVAEGWHSDSNVKFKDTKESKSAIIGIT